MKPQISQSWKEHKCGNRSKPPSTHVPKENKPCEIPGDLSRHPTSKWLTPPLTSAFLASRALSKHRWPRTASPLRSGTANAPGNRPGAPEPEVSSEFPRELPRDVWHEPSSEIRLGRRLVSVWVKETHTHIIIIFFFSFAMRVKFPILTDRLKAASCSPRQSNERPQQCCPAQGRTTHLGKSPLGWRRGNTGKRTDIRSSAAPAETSPSLTRLP